MIRLAVKRSKGSILCADKVVCKRVYEVERILLILTPQKWGVIIVQKGKKNILII